MTAETGRIVFLSEVPADKPPQLFDGEPDVMTVKHAASEEFQERIAELENQVEEMADGGERTCKLIVREDKEGIVCSECWTRHSGKVVDGVIFRTDPIDRYCRYCGSRITNPVDASDKYPHLTKLKKELQDEREKRLYLEHIVEELQDQATEVDVDPHLLDTHFAEASDAYERLFNEPMGVDE